MRPSAGIGIGGSTSLEPRREVAAEADALEADDVDRVLEVIDDAVERPLLVVDRDGVEHEAEEPAGVGERAELVVGQVARVVVDRPAARRASRSRERRRPGR